MSEQWHIAVLGATGEVGTALLELLQERKFPVSKLYLLAGEESAGKTIRFSGRSVKVQSSQDFDWSQVQIAFFMTTAVIAAQHMRTATEAGCIVLDSSGLSALHADIPLVIPAINSQALAHYRNRNIVAIPHSLTSQLLLAINPLITAVGVEQLQVTNLLAASVQGKGGVEELAGQSAQLLNGIPPEPIFFPRQLAFNLLPLSKDEAGSVREERQLIEEVRKILQIPDLLISTTAIQAPVFYGHVQLVQFLGERQLTVEESRRLITEATGQAPFQTVVLRAEEDYPTPVEDAAKSGQLTIGCVSSDYGRPQLLRFWSVADNIRFGGARMALEVAEKLVQEYY